ncbi:MAG: hypothetical protein JNM51_15950, partial [Bacteroidia bacterium]|nr:hypothetical protein [Bacteroidia bacterium]
MKKLVLLFIFIVAKQLIFSQCLNGIYTIGGASPSFTSITQAVNTLTVNGVCGPVTFNIRPGTYNERITIPVVAGTSSVNTIVFQSENADSSSVILQVVGNSTQNYVVKLDGTDYVSFNKLSFKNTDVNYSCIFSLLNGATNFSLTSCLLEVPIPLSSQANSNRYILNSSSHINTNCVIKNNSFIGGQRAIDFEPNNNSIIFDLKIIDNDFLNQYENAIYLLGVRNSQVIKNKTKYTLSNINYIGLYFNSCTTPCTIEKNMIDQSSGNGMYIYVIRYPSTNDFTTIFNNRINVAGSSLNYGMKLNQGDFKVYHNTIVSSNTFSASTCINSSTWTYSVDIKNNIFFNKGIGYALTATASALTSDFNDFYTTGSVLINDGSDKSLTNWQTLGNDLNSLNFKPQFISNSDFHIASDFSQNTVFPFISAVSDDLEGTLRDNTSPYFGAYEYNNLGFSTDASPKKFSTALVNNCEGSVVPVKVQLINYGNNSLNSVNLNWSINNILQSPFNWSGVLNKNDSISLNLGNINFTPLGKYIVKVWTTNPNGSLDEFIQNDTLKSSTLYSQLTGTYSIGSAGTFSTIAHATSILKSNGICGNVTLNLLSGTYNESFDLSSISKVSSQNSILIKSLTGVNSDVKINGTVALNPFLISNVSNITIKNITIGSITNTVTVFVVKENSNNIEINNCILNGNNVANNTVITSSLNLSTINNFRIINNDFRTGYKFIE